jgi:hypothetical protein
VRKWFHGVTTFEQLFNKDVQTTKKLKTPSNIHKQAQKFNKKRGK